MKKSVLSLVALIAIPLFAQAIILNPLDKKGTTSHRRLSREEGIAFMEKYGQQAMQGNGLTRSPSEQLARQAIDNLLEHFCSPDLRPCPSRDGYLVEIGKQMAILEKMNSDKDARARDVAEVVTHFREQLNDDPMKGEKCVETTLNDPYDMVQVTVECGDLEFEVSSGYIYFKRYNQTELK